MNYKLQIMNLRLGEVVMVDGTTGRGKTTKLLLISEQMQWKTDFLMSINALVDQQLANVLKTRGQQMKKNTQPYEPVIITALTK